MLVQHPNQSDRILLRETGQPLETSLFCSANRYPPHPTNMPITSEQHIRRTRTTRAPCLCARRNINGGHQSRKGRENIPVAGTNHVRGERIYSYRAPIAKGERIFERHRASE
eukprot:1182119-Prorocentrum_minimum.AAC.2